LLLLQINGFLERVDGVHPAVERGPGILILVYIDAVAHLIGPNLRINPQLIQEAGVSPAHDLEICPLKTTF